MHGLLKHSNFVLSHRSGSTKPFKVWDAVKKRHVLIRPWILFLHGDNPMQAELCSHIGLNGNYFCRMCHCGGDQKFKASNEGFASLMKVGPTLSSYVNTHY